jgi:hypothetical protein
MSQKFDVEVDANGRKFRVTGSTTPFRPATGPSMENAGGDPAEGGELEDLVVFLCRRRKDKTWTERKLCEAVTENLGIDDEIREALEAE